MHNELSYAEREAVDITVEEMGEVLQVIGKLGRFGKLATDHAGGYGAMTYDNLALLQKECIDVLAALMLLEYMGLINTGGGLAEAQLQIKVKELGKRFQHVDPVAWDRYAAGVLS